MSGSFAQFLQDELAERSLSYSEFALRAGLHVSLVSRVARGERKPSSHFLKQAARALQIPLERLMAAAGLFTEALGATGTQEAAVLAPYVQYAATAEGEEEINSRLPAKLARVGQIVDPSGKVALLVDLVSTLARRFAAADAGIKALIGGALLYFLAPVDMVPDFIPGAGLLDDLTILSLVIGLLPPLGPGRPIQPPAE